MMYVKKWPKKSKRSKYVLLNIIQKCKHCRTVVEIDSLNDLEYDGVFTLDGGLGFFDTLNHRYDWKYVCPYCNKKESLSDKNLDYVTKFIDSNDIDMKPYEAMDFISFKGDTYSVFYALWLHDKFGVQIHESLLDDEATKLYNKHFSGDVLTRDERFVSESELEQILDTIMLKEENKEED